MRSGARGVIIRVTIYPGFLGPNLVYTSFSSIIINSISFTLKSFFVWMINYIVTLVFINFPPKSMIPLTVAKIALWTLGEK